MLGQSLNIPRQVLLAVHAFGDLPSSGDCDVEETRQQALDIEVVELNADQSVKGVTT